MALSSSRALIAQGLVALLQGLQNGSQALYNDVRLGHMQDPTPFTAWAEVTFFQGQSSPAGSGGNLVGWRIDDKVAFALTSGFDYEQDTTAATLNMLTTMDLLLPLLHSHVLIPNPQNPAQSIGSVYSMLEEQPDRSQPVKFPNGRVYLLWHVYAVVRQQYNVTLTIP